MAFDAIAYAPDEPCSLTIDGAELLAHDVEADAPRWRLAFERELVAVLFVDPSALPPGAGGASGSPWRSAASTGRHVLALDVEGRLHLVDPTRGQALGAYGPFGEPRAIAASTTGASVALAVDDALLLWRSGERLDVPLRASAAAKVTAVAFSRDGATLAAARRTKERSGGSTSRELWRRRFAQICAARSLRSPRTGAAPGSSPVATVPSPSDRPASSGSRSFRTA